ncbi:hypothetical protein INR49_001959 [Caranx melampygus]|nr:hypothetical protein INR49_001959 [Caranx melampygus]
MNCLVTLILLFVGCSFISSSQYPLRTYYYVNLKVTWADAQQYCREKYTDLATIESGDDISMLKPNISYSWAWIGLKDDPASWKVTMDKDQNSWRWSATDTDQKEKIYEYFSTPKTWHSARDYCREYHTDLPMIEDSIENTEVASANPSDVDIWIGLYRVPWVWSDMSPSTFRNWRISKLQTVLRMTTETDADMTDSNINSQLLEKLDEVLRRQGWTNITLRWKTLARKLGNN